MVAARARDIYDRKAKGRRNASIKERDDKGRAKPVVENLSELEKGRSRDKAGRAVGVSDDRVEMALARKPTAGRKRGCEIRPTRND